MTARFACCLLTGALLFASPALRGQKSSAKLWLTNSDRSALFQQQKHSFHFSSTTSQGPTIEIDDAQPLQSIDGFGFALTWGSAEHIYRMDPAKRKALLKELFATGRKSIGI